MLRPIIATVAVTLLVIGLTGAAFVWSGLYPIAADVPHSRPVYALLETLRDRSIARHASGIAVPADLADPARIQSGAGLYAEMCASCHRAPGIEAGELAQGLYPQAPALAQGRQLSPAQQFWIIKHGVKLSAMPAWGRTHPDALIWDMVAFVRALPGLDPVEYRAMTSDAPAAHDEAIAGAGHDHHH